MATTNVEPHVHAAESFTFFPSGDGIAVCECGATAMVTRLDPEILVWHACCRCAHPHGMPRSESVSDA
jgi:hypothetical protein